MLWVICKLNALDPPACNIPGRSSYTPGHEQHQAAQVVRGAIKETKPGGKDAPSHHLRNMKIGIGAVVKCWTLTGRYTYGRIILACFPARTELKTRKVKEFSYLDGFKNPFIEKKAVQGIFMKKSRVCTFGVE
ncbi:hypothetical protein AVEN_122837-1 [Araneus ventricosus]|uniref:Uncharacterized protein n=1 Tax=Araneus ventricosus TaxID=182803 RepID=A0A4Y2TNR7_ARAVE|nr:hypothetical protein AVEN_122837-1 [Araneus ventricosus]